MLPGNLILRHSVPIKTLLFSIFRRILKYCVLSGGTQWSCRSSAFYCYRSEEMKTLNILFPQVGIAPLHDDRPHSHVNIIKYFIIILTAIIKYIYIDPNPHLAFCKIHTEFRFCRNHVAKLQSLVIARCIHFHKPPSLLFTTFFNLILFRVYLLIYVIWKLLRNLIIHTRIGL